MSSSSSASKRVRLIPQKPLLRRPMFAALLVGIALIAIAFSLSAGRIGAWFALNHALYLVDEGQRDEAIEWLERAEERYPSSVPLWEARNAILALEGRFDEIDPDLLSGAREADPLLRAVLRYLTEYRTDAFFLYDQWPEIELADYSLENNPPYHFMEDEERLRLAKLLTARATGDYGSVTSYLSDLKKGVAADSLADLAERILYVSIAIGSGSYSYLDEPLAEITYHYPGFQHAEYDDAVRHFLLSQQADDALGIHFINNPISIYSSTVGHFRNRNLAHRVDISLGQDRDIIGYWHGYNEPYLFYSNYVRGNTITLEENEEAYNHWPLAIRFAYQVSLVQGNNETPPLNKVLASFFPEAKNYLEYLGNSEAKSQSWEANFSPQDCAKAIKGKEDNSKISGWLQFKAGSIVIPVGGESGLDLPPEGELIWIGSGEKADGEWPRILINGLNLHPLADELYVHSTRPILLRRKYRLDPAAPPEEIRLTFLNNAISPEAEARGEDRNVRHYGLYILPPDPEELLGHK